ncbi:SAM-dependent methyltransferase [Streptomyces boncukensis]
MPEIDTTTPHSARFWNFWVGGKDYYEVDAEIAERIAERWPGLIDVARTSRYFLVRAVRHLAGEAGIRQFLDIGTGLPTVDPVHAVAQELAPSSRVVYVDNDPLVLAHAQARLTSSHEGRTAYLDGDVHDPRDILSKAGETIDFNRPVAVILMGILGHVADYQEARAIVDELMGGVPSGSYLVLRDCTSTSDHIVAAADAYNSSGAVPYNLRTAQEVTGFFEGLEVLEPGVVQVPDWRPEVADPAPASPVDALAGVARKP